MADWSTPTLTSSYSDFLTQVKARDTDLALQFDGTTSTSLTTGTIRWDSTDNRWKKWNGTSWAELTSSYNLNSLTLPNGTANGVAYLNGSKVLTTGSGFAYNPSTSQNTLYVEGVNSTGVFNAIGSAFPGVQFKVSGTYKNGISNDSDNLTFDSNGGTAHRWTFGGGEYMRLTSTGLGIGTSSPAQKLDVVGRIRVEGTAGDTSGVLEFKNYAGNLGYAYLDNSQNFVFSTGGLIQWNTGSGLMKLDASGNLGLGVTPSAWTSNRKAMQFATAGSVFSTTANNQMNMASNMYLAAGGVTYLQSDYASLYTQYAGQHQFYTAPSGTAGNPITFTQAMTLDASGNLGVGYSTPSNFNAIQTAGQAYVFGPGTGSPAITLFGSSSGTSRVAFAKGLTGNDQYRGFIEYGYSSDYMAFITGASERMRIDSSGNVGIGTTSISTALTIQTPSGRTDAIACLGNNGTANNAASFGMFGNATYVSANWYYAGGQAKRVSGNGSSAINLASGTTDADTNIVFGVGKTTDSTPVERMRIDSSGNLLVATTSKVGRLTVKQTTDDYGYGIAILMSNSTNHWQQIAASDTNFYFGYNGTGVARINSGTGAYTAISDERLKKDIENISLGLTTVLNLRPVEYLMNHETSGSQKHLGFIAQESKPVIPSAVSEMTDGILGMDKTEIIPVLVKAIQELKAELDATKAEVAALKGK